MQMSCSFGRGAAVGSALAAMVTLSGSVVLAEEPQPAGGASTPASVPAEQSLSVPEQLSFRPSQMYGSGVVDRPAWRANAMVYVWLTGLTGDIQARGNKVDVDETFIDLVDKSSNLFGIGGRLEVGQQRLSAYVDGTYMSLRFDDRGDPADPADVKTPITIIEFGAIYRAAEWALGDEAEAKKAEGVPPRRVLGLDVYAGGRYMDIGVDLDFQSGREDSRNKSWIDPLIGARAIIDLSERWVFTIGADIGGFGVGSDFCWQAYGLFNYRFDMWGADAALVLGFKALYEDFDEGQDDNRVQWDVTLYGPVIGLQFQF